jgi:hypothetical protein
LFENINKLFVLQVICVFLKWRLFIIIVNVNCWCYDFLGFKYFFSSKAPIAPIDDACSSNMRYSDKLLVDRFLQNSPLIEAASLDSERMSLDCPKYLRTFDKISRIIAQKEGHFQHGISAGLGSFALKKAKILNKQALALEKIKILSEAIHLYNEGQLSSEELFLLKPMHQVISMKEQVLSSKKIKKKTRVFIDSECVKLSSQIHQVIESILRPSLQAPNGSKQISKRDQVGPDLKKINLLKKWKSAGQDESICLRFPSFVQFLEDFKILPYLRISRDLVKMVNGKPALLVEGRLLNEAQLRDRFDIIYSERFEQYFVQDKQTKDVYTYLDNGLGLESFHPYLTPLKRPISTLNEEEYLRVLQTARKFQKSDGPRAHIVQIVSSKLEGPENNAFNLLHNAKHPWFRYICWNPETKQGEVYEVGFGWEKPPAYFDALKTQPGVFRSPDVWELKPTKSRVITNIPVSDQQLGRFIAFLEKNIQKSLDREIGFQFDRHNCTALIFEGAQELGFSVEAKMNLLNIVWHCAPGLPQFFAGQKPKGSSSSEPGQPGMAQKVLSAISAPAVSTVMGVGVLGVNSFRYWLGAGAGQSKISLNAAELTPDFETWPDFLDTKNLWMYLPGALQKWQLEQESTVEFFDTNRLCIVPPLSAKKASVK